MRQNQLSHKLLKYYKNCFVLHLQRDEWGNDIIFMTSSLPEIVILGKEFLSPLNIQSGILCLY